VLSNQSRSARPTHRGEGGAWQNILLWKNRTPFAHGQEHCALVLLYPVCSFTKTNGGARKSTSAVGPPSLTGSWAANGQRSALLIIYH